MRNKKQTATIIDGLIRLLQKRGLPITAAEQNRQIEAIGTLLLCGDVRLLLAVCAATEQTTRQATAQRMMEEQPIEAALILTDRSPMSRAAGKSKESRLPTFSGTLLMKTDEGIACLCLSAASEQELVERMAITIAEQRALTVIRNQANTLHSRLETICRSFNTPDFWSATAGLDKTIPKTIGWSSWPENKAAIPPSKA